MLIPIKWWLSNIFEWYFCQSDIPDRNKIMFILEDKSQTSNMQNRSVETDTSQSIGFCTPFPFLLLVQWLNRTRSWSNMLFDHCLDSAALERFPCKRRRNLQVYWRCNKHSLTNHTKAFFKLLWLKFTYIGVVKTANSSVNCSSIFKRTGGHKVVLRVISAEQKFLKWNHTLD